MPEYLAPLSGKTILVTRAETKAGELVREIQRYGGTAVVFPTIEIRPARSYDDCDRSIDAIASYDGLVFTSENGVRYFLERWTLRGHSVDQLRSKLVCVVGEKTGRTAVECGLPVTLMPERFTAADLARAIAGENLAGKRFLFPRGDLGGDTLARGFDRLGAGMDSVVVYETHRPHPENERSVRMLLLEGGVDILTFTSPSSFTNFAAIFSDEEIMKMRPRMMIAAIGAATAAAINRYGIQADIIPAESSIESMVKSIADVCRSGSAPAASAGALLFPRNRSLDE